MRKTRKYLNCIAASVLLSYCSFAYAGTQDHTKIWINGDIYGPLSSTNPKWKYHLEPRMQFIDDRYKFEETYVYAGPGYQFTPTLALYVGGTWVVDKSLQGKVTHEERLWQQLDLDAYESHAYKVTTRTRFEERRNLENTGIGIRFRQKISWRMPLKKWENHSIVINDEIFLNLNHPTWLSTPFFDQNRAFIGIGTKVTKQLTIDVGYMNQYIYSTPKQVNSILYTSFNLKLT